ncbi:unnamed protein product [Clonostachys chloroleuca]|uniref:Protein kinase domain-containing protein n=1 Tax=Clonostachys chloroleuca TaxID=1926264 RepID=A0AA35QDY1_9HYPO|nr:unnamed protein product [Clonostachys chloroleuca]
MDFLKSAVASAMASGPPFPYTYGDKVDIDESIWTLHNGTKREDGSNCSIFSFDIPANKSLLPLAKNALKKLRTLRHPGVLKVHDTVETETKLLIATERVVPLRWHIRRKSLSPETIKWGLHGIARTIKFINGDASSIHGSLKVGSIYTSESGEWKLGGFEVLSSIKDDESVIYTYGSLVPDSPRYSPPEVAQNGWEVIKKHPQTAVDAFDFGILVFEVFNGEYNGTDQAGQTKNVPPSMQSSYRRLCNNNPKARISVGNFLDQGVRTGSFFDNSLIKLTEGIDNLGVKTPEEREEFLSDLDQLSDDFPEDFFKLKVLPELIKSVEYGGGGPKALSVIFKIATKMSNEDFESKITPFVVRAFSNPDRALRVCLLDNLHLMIDRIPQKIVNDKIFPQLVTGFTDVAPVVREQTLKSVLVIVPKLSDRTINGDLLKQLAKTANDEQPGIRTNTTICLGKISKHLGSSTRSKVLTAAFSRSLRDPFVPARNAALMALGATVEHFSDEDCAGKILPVVCPLLMDKDKLVRDSANRTVDTYLVRIRKAASEIPDTTTTAPQPSISGIASPNVTQGEVAGWTGWAISSFTNKLSASAGSMQATNGNLVSPQPSPALDPRKSGGANTPLTASRVTSPNPTTVARAFFPPEEPQDDAGDGWGDMADDDDDGFSEKPSSSAGQKNSTPTVATAPFDDGGEPDFASWLEQRAKGPAKSKPLPKGLAKSTTTAAGAKKTVTKPVAKPAAKPLAAKKINMAPKASADDDEGWGDGRHQDAPATKVAHSKKQASKITKPKQRSKGNPDKVHRKFTSGMTARTEALLGERAGHLELIGQGKKGKKVAKAGGSKRFG